MKKIAILGSTGSVGRQAIDLVSSMPNHFQVVAIAANTNIELLEKQAHLCTPKMIGVFDETRAKILQKRLPKIAIEGSMQGLLEVATIAEADIVLVAISGNIALLPCIAAIEANKQIALANKEVLVSAGDLVMDLANKNRVKIIPVDSEHSALFQLLEKKKQKYVKRLILTASGGPFFHFSKNELQEVSLKQALCHPTFQMGNKITIDSSTLMNKGLELIEAKHLFGLEMGKIDMVIHPQSIVHSMVEFVDGSIHAQLSLPDMSLPILYAFSYPERVSFEKVKLDFTKQQTLEFFPPDRSKFKAIDLAYFAANEAKSYPCYMNSANEILVKRFLQNEISWSQIIEKLEKLITSHTPKNMLGLDAVLEIDALARDEALQI